MNDNSNVKTLQKALDLLEVFNQEKRPMGITELSKKLGLYKSNVYNLVSTLEKNGYLFQNKETSKYYLGLKIVNLSHSVTSNLTLNKVIYPFIKLLADKSGENVYFAVPYKQNVIYLDLVIPSTIGGRRAIVGNTAPMYCTGLGKAVLMMLPPDELQTIVDETFAEPVERFTPYTIMNKEDLYKELDKCRERGYAVDNMEHEYGVKCVAMPVVSQGKVVAAISTSGPSLRFDEAGIRKNYDLLREIIREIEVAFDDYPSLIYG